MADPDAEAEVAIARKVIEGEWGAAFLDHLSYVMGRSLRVLRDEGVYLEVATSDGRPVPPEALTLKNGQLLKVVTDLIPAILSKPNCPHRVVAAASILIGVQTVMDELQNPTWENGEVNLAKLSLTNTSIGAWSYILWGADGMAGAARELIERDVTKTKAATAGKASGAARAWWHKIALPRAKEKRRLSPQISTADLGRLLRTEMERTHPPGAGGKPNKLPKTGDGYESAIRAWEKSGELPRQAESV